MRIGWGVAVRRGAWCVICGEQVGFGLGGFLGGDGREMGWILEGKKSSRFKISWECMCIVM